MFKFFDLNSECFTKYNAFCSHIFDYAFLTRNAYCFQRGSKLQKLVKLTSKTFLKMAGGKMHTPHPTPLHKALAISCRSYRTHQKSLALFSHMAPLILFFLLKGKVKGGGAWSNAPLNTLLHSSLVVASLNKMLHGNYLCLEEFNKQLIEEVGSKIQAEKSETRAMPKQVWICPMHSVSVAFS